MNILHSKKETDVSKIARYQVFVSIVEKGSLAAAAEALMMSPSSVSKHLSKLEAELGASLIDRTTYNLAVTEQGMGFYERVKRILGEIEEAEEWLQQKTSRLEGRLILSVPQILLKSPFLAVLAEFNELHPGIRFDIKVSNRFDDWIERKFDFAFRIGALKDSQYVAIPVSKLNVLFCASPAYLDKHVDLKPSQLLKEDHLILPTYTHSTALQQLLQQKSLVNKDVSQRFHGASDALMVDEMARAGLGVSASFDIAVMDDLRRGNLVSLKPPYKAPKFDLNLIYYKRENLPARMYEFKEFMKENLGTAFKRYLKG